MTPRQRMRGLLAIGFAVPVFLVVLTVGQPAMMGVGDIDSSMPWWAEWALAIPIGGMLVGLGLMVRIYRATYEADPPAWRYRDRR